jgi:hypothetical protein
VSRSGYTDDCEGRDLAMWRGQVASAIRGKRGQTLLRELLEALDAMPEKRLIAHALKKDGEVCALGSLGIKRKIELEALDPENYDALADTFGVAHQLIQEIEFMNDEVGSWHVSETPEHRWQRMRNWVSENLRATPPA